MQAHILSSAPTIDEYDGQEAFLNETATTITVLLKPAQAKGAPIRYSKCCHLSWVWLKLDLYWHFLHAYSAYQIVVEEVNPQRTRRQASSDCYEVIVDLQMLFHYHTV